MKLTEQQLEALRNAVIAAVETHAPGAIYALVFDDGEGIGMIHRSSEQTANRAEQMVVELAMLLVEGQAPTKCTRTVVMPAPKGKLQ